jgi:hypothetical protein
MSLYRESVRFLQENPANKYPISLRKTLEHENPQDTLLPGSLPTAVELINYTGSHEILKRTMADLP